jgi:hypothetical protein
MTARAGTATVTGTLVGVVVLGWAMTQVTMHHDGRHTVLMEAGYKKNSGSANVRLMEGTVDGVRYPLLPAADQHRTDGSTWKTWMATWSGDQSPTAATVQIINTSGYVVTFCRLTVDGKVVDEDPAHDTAAKCTFPGPTNHH